MSDEITEKSSKVWLYVTGGVMALPLIYWLSLGPVTVLWARKVISHTTIAIYCKPLNYFYEYIGTDFGMETYMKAWCSLTGTPCPW
jgi:hypothetical protein